MNVLYQCDDNYAPYLGVSLTSLLSNSRCSSEINVIILDFGISKENLDKIRAVCERYGSSCLVIPCEDIEYFMRDHGVPPYRDSYATFAKLFVREKISFPACRLLYIDCDTVIQSDLGELYHIDMKGNPIAMAEDLLAYRYKKRIGFSADECYYNAGVILFDYGIWNREDWNGRLKQFLGMKWDDGLLKHDQDVFNLVFRGRVTKLPLRYNAQSILASAGIDDVYQVYKRVWSDSGEQIREEKENAVILHFLRFLGESPWDRHSLHPYKKEFDRYAQQSLWKEQEQPVSHRSFLYRIEEVLFRVLPGRAFLLLFKLVHDVFGLI